MAVLVTIEAVVIALLAVLMAGLLRSHADILRALHELGVSEPGETPLLSIAHAGGDATEARDIVGARPGGGAAKLGVVGTSHDTLIAFLSSGCSSCATFWSAFENEMAELPGQDTRLVVVTKGPGEESEAHVAGLAPSRVPVVMSTEAWDDYSVPVTPYFVLVEGASGRIAGEGAANGWDQVTSLLSQAAADADLATRHTVPRNGGFRQREAKADEELAAAGIHPGHPSLHPEDV